MGAIQSAFGPEGVSQAVKPTEYASRVAAALGIDPNGLIPTEEDMAEQQQQSQMAELVKTLGPEALRQFGSNATGRNVASINADAKLASQEAQPPATTTPPAGGQ